MVDLVRYRTADGIEIDFAVAEAAAGFEDARNDAVATAAETLDAALGRAAAVVRATKSALAAVRPDELEISFGLTASGTTSIIVASGTIEANITIKATWKAGSEPDPR